MGEIVTATRAALLVLGDIVHPKPPSLLIYLLKLYQRGNVLKVAVF